MGYVTVDMIHKVAVEDKENSYQTVPFKLESLYKLPEYTEMTPEVQCLAENIYHEARNQSIEGMAAVAAVTINRKNSKQYPNTICEVVHDPYQFSWVHQNMEKRLDNPIERKAWEVSKEIAFMVLNEGVPHDMIGVFHYHADHVTPRWAAVKQEHKRIDNHVFYI
jgi:spore germination cell wall hydrolase CwlJ-like protein